MGNGISTLVKDTTREQREEFVKSAVALSTLDAPAPDSKAMEYYSKYIDGEMELEDVVKAIKAFYNCEFRNGQYN